MTQTQKGGRLAGMAVVAVVVTMLAHGSAVAGDLFGEIGVTLPKVRVEAPAFTLAGSGGGQKSLAGFKGKIILLNFWATWCVPCRAEMPSMEKLWQKYRHKGFAIVAVSVDRGNSDAVRRFVDEHRLTFTVLLDPDGEVRNSYEVNAFPTSYLIGKDGKFLGKIIGEREWNSLPAFDLIESLLEKEKENE